MDTLGALVRADKDAILDRWKDYEPAAHHRGGRSHWLWPQ
jgi:hypothetical protein